MDEGWIKIYRSILKWEWHDDPKMMSLWVHLLVMANHEGKKWHGQVIERGQVVASRKGLSLDVGISEQSVRTGLDRLEEGDMITRKSTNQSTNRKTIITITNYNRFQDIHDDNQPTDNQPTTNQQPTNNQPNKKERKKEDNIILSLNIPHACEENLLGVEVAKKALCTEEMVRRVYQQYHEDINAIKQGIIDFLKVNEFNDWKSENDIKDHFIKWWRDKHPVKDMQKIAKQNEGQRVVGSSEDEVRRQREKHKQDDEFNNMLARIAKEHGCSQIEAVRIYNNQLNNGTQGET